MIDVLWIAAEGVAYALSGGARPDVVWVDFLIERHPCDDQLYVANVAPAWPRHVPHTTSLTYPPAEPARKEAP